MEKPHRIVKIEKKYNTISKLIAHNYSEYIGICTDNKNYFIHKRNDIYSYVNPMSKYTDARYIDDILCIIV